MKRDEIRRELIDGTIHVIAREGLDGASAKQIEAATGINVAYIYRCFKDKDDMFSAAFRSLDHELIDEILKRLPIINTEGLDIEERCRLLFIPIWRFLLGNREKCLCYIRYYYSPYFKKYSHDEHERDFEIINEKFSVVFNDDANVSMVLDHILNIMCDFAVKVFNETVTNDDETVEHIFKLIYHSVYPYLRKRSLQGKNTVEAE